MLKSRPKAPKETKAQLMEDVLGMMQAKYGINAGSAILHLLNYFTAIDLEGIRNDLKKENG